MVVDPSNSISNVRLGSRVEYARFYGTVKYTGTVDGYEGSWLGIDWDDPSRGKHDGSLAGKRYFTTSHAASGSFVRPAKVQTGNSAVYALTSRYGQQQVGTEAQIYQQQLLHLQKEINAPFLTMVGFDKINLKQSKFENLYVISLRMQFVNRAGEEGELMKLCPNIQELDISKNLLSEWSTVFTICNQLEHLHWLNLSENYMDAPPVIENTSFPSIRTLITGFMKLSWDDILKISQTFTAIEEFRIPYNLISSIELPEKHNLSLLKLLDIEGNHIGKWADILNLGTLPNLEMFNVAKTGISNIYFPCEWDEKTDLFVNLKHLMISENLIETWHPISELNKLQNLDDLRFLKNPVLESENAPTCVQLIIAKIENLKILNGTTIKTEERKGAEYDYIKKHGLEWIKICNNEEQKKFFLEKHPQYLNLITKHGIPDESELIVKPQSLKNSLLAVDIQFEDKIIQKKLPPTMTLQKLIMLVQKLFKLSVRPTLYYINNAQESFEIEMTDEFKEIGFYSLQDGDMICVRI